MRPIETLVPHLCARMTRFEAASEREQVVRSISAVGESTATAAFAGASWEIRARLGPVAGRADAVDGQVMFRVADGAAREVAVAIEWTVADWSRDVFVMLPAAAYNGNRYPCRPYKYPPLVHEPDDIGPDAPILVTDVPRLSHADGTPSRIQLRTGDLTTPAICFHDPRGGRAAILLTDQGSALGNHGLTVEESLDRSSAVLRIDAPGVRRDTLYHAMSTATPSWDRGADWKPGDAVTLRFRLFRFPAKDVQALYDRFAIVRKDLTGPVRLEHRLPFSAAFAINEEKQERENWCEDGYYRVGTHEAAATNMGQDWQVGWVGGGMKSAAFLIAGQAGSWQHAVRELDWMFERAQLSSGLIHAGQHKGQAYGDSSGFPGAERWYMTRKQADALYFLLKAFHALHGLDAHWQLPAGWAAGTRRLADRLVDSFRRFGQLGQYLDCVTGDVLVGGSTAAAMAPGALALAGQYFACAEYLEAADTLARHLDDRDVRSGVTNGGPGEILKCPDSESAFAMLESFVVLYEVTGNPHWLARAEAMAAQCLTWCASYDHVFPPESPFGQLDMRAAGSVWANVQNKHSAPGICTLSGDALFKLFRYTGNRLWLDQIQETAHNLPQYLSRVDRPVGTPPAMRPGYMCERVNFSDWEQPWAVGSMLFGSCWCEVSLLLTVAELPGIYVQPDTGLLCVLDHLHVRLIGQEGQSVILECQNPTAFEARVSVLAEPSASAGTVLGQAAALHWPTFEVAAGGTCRWKVPVSGARTDVTQLQGGYRTMNAGSEPPVSRFIRERWKDTVRVHTRDEGTHLGLPYPYTVPCAKGGFEHMYYWDTYFICRGLELQGFHQQVRWNCDNLIHLLERFGFVPNASCNFLVKCSQPPYLGETAALVLKQSPDEAWRRRAAEALEREHGFWMRRRLLPCGLNHYGHHLGDMIGEAGVPARLEQEFERLLVGRMGMAPVADPVERRRLASHTLAEAESGWDFTPRFARRCTGIAAVDLNSILYRSEQVLAELWAGLAEPARAARWRAAAEDRAALIRRLCWDEAQGCFADWDPDAGRCLTLVTAATFQPLWAGIATPEQARRTVALAERRLLLPHGVVTCAANDSGLNYQWDHPNAWPPLQLIAWEACDRYGFDGLARRIAAAYAATVERNFEATGDLWEKYNACDGTIQVQDEYEMPAMMDWTAGAYLVARQRLDGGEARWANEVRPPWSQSLVSQTFTPRRNRRPHVEPYRSCP